MSKKRFETSQSEQDRNHRGTTGRCLPKCSKTCIVVSYKTRSYNHCAHPVFENIRWLRPW